MHISSLGLPKSRLGRKKRCRPPEECISAFARMGAGGLKKEGECARQSRPKALMVKGGGASRGGRKAFDFVCFVVPSFGLSGQRVGRIVFRNFPLASALARSRPMKRESTYQLNKRRFLFVLQVSIYRHAGLAPAGNGSYHQTGSGGSIAGHEYVFSKFRKLGFQESHGQ